MNMETINISPVANTAATATDQSAAPPGNRHLKIRALLRRHGLWLIGALLVVGLGALEYSLALGKSKITYVTAAVERGVSVTERTREIGIRMAIGACGFDVLFQFLTEAIVVCFVGGLAGIVVGIGGGLATSALAGWRVIFTIAPIIIAFACAFLTGIIFGYLPARKAAQLDPIDALARE
jgi:predicted lysophospholipase L1 biosynthesis ABC-type transport system permease subunit